MTLAQAARDAEESFAWGEAVVPMIIVLVVLTLTGLFQMRVARKLADGSIRRNWLMGVRTTATRSSDEAWLVAQKAGEADLVRTGWTAIATGPAAMLVAVAVGATDAERAMIGWGIALGIGMVALMAFAIRGTVRGHRAAKAYAGT
ncbi:MAG: SdpI family protein [Actinomycetota bacterium]